MRKLSLLALVLGVAGFAACRGSDGDDTGGHPDSNGGGGDDVKIQAIQDPAMTNGTPVTVKGVVVTAIDTFGGKTGDFWIQEPEGGEFSGIHVFGAPLDQVAALKVGDVVDVKGAEKDDFAYMGNNGSGGFEPGYAITELKPVSGGVMTVSKTGANTPLEPHVVDARMIGGLSDFMARDAEWEKWEGVLIKLDNVTAATDQACVGSACSDQTLQKLEVTGGAVVESSLAAFPADYKSMLAINRGDCLASVTGVLDYFFDYLLLPRSTTEYALTGGNCPTETSMAQCTDGIDNDSNGFTDCDDNACVVNVASCRTVTTIQAIQTAVTPPTGPIEIQNVYVTALQNVAGTTFKPKNMYVQTAPQAAASNGILVFGNNSTDFSPYAVGTKVNVIGKVKEFNDSMNNGTGTLTEISLLSVSAASGTGTIAPVTGQTVTTLSVDATGEPYEGVLVTLDNVKIKTIPDTNYHVGTMTQAGIDFKFDDDLYLVTSPAMTCMQHVTGVWSYQVYDNAWYFLPTEAPDTTGGTCP